MAFFVMLEKISVVDPYILCNPDPALALLAIYWSKFPEPDQSFFIRVSDPDPYWIGVRRVAGSGSGSESESE